MRVESGAAANVCWDYAKTCNSSAQGANRANSRHNYLLLVPVKLLPHLFSQALSSCLTGKVRTEFRRRVKSEATLWGSLPSSSAACARIERSVSEDGYAC